MRNRTVITVLGIVFSLTLTHAQLIRGYGFKIGAVAANQTWYHTNVPDLATDSRWGFTASGFVEVLDVPIFSIIAEAQYTQKGMQFSPQATVFYGLPQPDTFRPRVDYLSVPLLAKVRISSPVFEPYFIAGPRLDFLLSRNSDGFDPAIDSFVNFEYGGTAGLGVEIGTLPPIHILAEFRYNASMKDAFNNGSFKITNRSFDFMLGVRL
jgi:hypothetical protein